MEKINVAKLLKDCPLGMELDCTMWDSLYFDGVEDDFIYCYYELDGIRNVVMLYENGCYTSFPNSKCVIFPKGKTTWEGFVPPCKFKDGDVLFVDCSDYDYQYIFILNKPEFLGKWHSYCMLDEVGIFQPYETYLIDEKYHPRLATEEEKQKLFDAIKANGYRWNTETKTMEKLAEPKFKDGDILTYMNCNKPTIYIYRENGRCNTSYYAGYSFANESFYKGKSGGLWGDRTDLRLATEEEKQKLFDAIKANGYKWNAETKTLESLVEPKFKAGSMIIRKKGVRERIQILDVDLEERGYLTSIKGCMIRFEDQDKFELLSGKFDITTLKPFEKVLARDADNHMWLATLFSHLRGTKFYTTSSWYNQCIPFDGNEHLCGKTDDCADFFKTW